MTELGLSFLPLAGEGQSTRAQDNEAQASFSVGIHPPDEGSGLFCPGLGVGAFKLYVGPCLGRKRTGIEHRWSFPALGTREADSRELGARGEMGHLAHQDGFSMSVGVRPSQPAPPPTHQHLLRPLPPSSPSTYSRAVVALRAAGGIPRAADPTCGGEAKGHREPALVVGLPETSAPAAHSASLRETCPSQNPIRDQKPGPGEFSR